MIICQGIEKVNGGYIIKGVRFPYAQYDDKGQVVCKTWAEVHAHGMRL